MNVPLSVFELLVDGKFDEAAAEADCTIREVAFKQHVYVDGSRVTPAQYLAQHASADTIRAFHAAVGFAPFRESTTDFHVISEFPLCLAVGRDPEVFRAVLDAMEGKPRQAFVEAAMDCVTKSYVAGFEMLESRLQNACEGMGYSNNWRAAIVANTASCGKCMPLHRVLVEHIRANDSETLMALADTVVAHNNLPLLDAIGVVSKRRGLFTRFLCDAAFHLSDASEMARALVTRYGVWPHWDDYYFLNMRPKPVAHAKKLLAVAYEARDAVSVFTLKCCANRKQEKLFLPEELYALIYYEFMLLVPMKFI